MAQITVSYEEIYDYENLYTAYLHARKNKRYRDEVLAFTANLDEELLSLQNDLIWKTYQVGKYRLFWVSDPKKRLVMSLRFRDRVLQWAVYQKLDPLLERQYIDDSYGCREGKGTHSALNRLQYWLCQVDRKEKRYYYLKLDISKYFYRVNHEALFGILSKKIQDQDILQLLKKIIESEDTKFGLPRGLGPADLPTSEWLNDVGMPIGNLTSQMFANVYLNEVDQYAKHVLKLHYYVRYMDDIIILGDDKSRLWQIKDAIEAFLSEHLRLDLNNKTTVRPISTGIEFVGYRLWPTHRKLKRSTLKKIKNRLKVLQKLYDANAIDYDFVQRSLSSYRGVMKYFNSYGLRQSLNRRHRFKKPAESEVDSNGNGYGCDRSP